MKKLIKTAVIALVPVTVACSEKSLTDHRSYASKSPSSQDLNLGTPAQPYTLAGHIKVLALRAHYEDIRNPCSRSKLLEKNDQNSQYANYYRSLSGNRLTLDVSTLKPFRLEVKAKKCPFGKGGTLTGIETVTIMDRAVKQIDQQIAERGIDTSSYDRIVYLLPPRPCIIPFGQAIERPDAGTMSVGKGRYIWTADSSCDLNLHELGHTLGLGHAGALPEMLDPTWQDKENEFFDGLFPSGDPKQWAQYAETPNLMGGYPYHISQKDSKVASSSTPALNAPHMLQFGWLDQNEVELGVNETQAEILPVHAQQSALKVIQIAGGYRNEPVYVSYRKIAPGADAGLLPQFSGKVYIHSYPGEIYSPYDHSKTVMLIDPLSSGEEYTLEDGRTVRFEEETRNGAFISVF